MFTPANFATPQTVTVHGVDDLVDDGDVAYKIVTGTVTQDAGSNYTGLNPADVSVVNERTLVVLGKRPGVTTVMVFGAGGRTLASRQIVVSEAGDSGVTVYRGVNAAGYACAGRCTRVGAAATAPAAGAP